ncbi:hypothetical protein DOI81_18925 [Salmonella enterica subsp. enterica serovar Gaminara]|uniref:Uncharacterized protein n=1 Tax=Salmonella enterica subsp. enterica serovar Reading TaxID=165302 RepID=A0A5I2WQR7_SALET|nr:hypothetical protein [Salmonella enterica]EAA6522349.1 hypothetical protein [Salmonella enterica subsp. enterica serovar Reading]EBW6719379.1 hypothetical protein [Salmonella enterica subsp. enterica serovar Stanley]EDQ6419556.1 hypothetical protein [Salmonella enterica subsp. enterica]EEO2920893.1 hypothetical protein [Salmonella enterica subsp. enterica serovar Hvittingfoss]EHA9323612.1 hypothetical protein [Salmonella enterica subsp. enterica serovar Bovismorbificans]EHD5304322.1 hypoth
MSCIALKGKLQYFLETLESIEDALPSLRKNLRDEYYKKNKNCDDFIETNAKDIERNEDGKIIRFSIHRSESYQFKRIKRERDKSIKLSLVIPNNLLVAIVSEYDAFLGDLIREIYNSKPESVHGFGKEFSFKEIIDFGSIDALKEHVIEKDIESILRNSHLEQIYTLEKKFNIELTKGLDILPSFIEITERRNLFVHCKGIVSSQYIKVCTENNVQLDNITVGKKLYASNDYIFKAINIFSEMAIKLTHVLWNKIFKEDIKHIEKSIHDISYETLDRGKYELVIAISPLFLSKSFNSIGEAIKRTTLINYCIALKENGNKKASDRLLDEYDWTACDPAFKMAEKILREDYKTAAAYMKKSYDMGDLQKEDIDQWPLFLQFRKTDEFKELYDLLFGKEEAINITLVDEDSQTKEAEAEVQAQETAEVQAQETAEVQTQETAEVQAQETAEVQAMLSTEKSQQATSQTMDYTKQDSAINAM